MADVTVKTVELELRTVKLTKSVLKQIPVLRYEQVRDLLKDAESATEKFKDGVLIGWVHGSVFGNDHDTYLILKTGEGTYGRFDAMSNWRTKCPQIYIV